MAVTRLRTHRDVEKQTAFEAVLNLLGGVAGSEDVVAFVERKLAAGRGWKFVMVEPVLYAEVVEHLLEHSKRPQKAVRLFTRLFTVLPPDGNEIAASRSELARMASIAPSSVSEIMGELEAVGAVYRRREGRGVRYFVNPLLGTHLAGAARDRAQGEAPPLRLVEPASSDR
jgi:DNA-binding transcriptional ArsR family regulator